MSSGEPGKSMCTQLRLQAHFLPNLGSDAAWVLGSAKETPATNRKDSQMTTNRVFRRTTLRFLAPVAIAGVIGLSVLMTAGAAAGPDNSAPATPTIVLLHGAWA